MRRERKMKKKLFVIGAVVAMFITSAFPIYVSAEEAITPNAVVSSEETEEAGQSESQESAIPEQEKKDESLFSDDSTPQKDGKEIISDSITEEESTSAPQLETENEKDGFVEENGHIFYYENGQMVVDRNIVVNGIIYSFDQVGYLKQGFQENIQDQNGNTGSYYYTDRAPYVFQGELKVNGKWRYFGSDGKMIQDQIYSLGSKTVYYGEDGGMVYGEKKIENEWYYFDTYTGAMQTGFVQLAGKTVYYYVVGKMAHGAFEIANIPYYSDEYTGAVLLGLQKMGDDKYYYTSKGAVKGEIKIGNSWYYFDEVTAKMRTGFVDHSGSKYYYNEDGTMVHGEKKIDVNGEQFWFYFDSYTGIMHIGFTQLPNKVVYYDENGRMQYGDQLIGGNNYYFDMITGAMKMELNIMENEK